MISIRICIRYQAKRMQKKYEKGLLEIFYVNIQNKKRGLFTSSTFSRYRQTPVYLKRANAHAERREQSTSVLDKLSILPIFENKNQKWTFQSFVFILSLLCHHKRFVFRV